MIKLSFIVPVYDVEDYVEQCVKSLCNQTINDIEIIIVNDGTQDNSIEKIEKINDDRIKIINQENSGLSSARNNGLKVAMTKADIIGFLDADLGSSTKEVEKIINPILNDEADVIIAKFPPAKKKGGLGFVKGLAKDSVFEMTGVELDATLSGQRLFKKEVLEKFDEIPFGYGVEVGMTIDILDRKSVV